MTVASATDPIDVSESEQRLASRSDREILASLDVTVPRTAVPTGYGIALALLAAWLTLIPLIYLAMVAFLTYLVFWHAYQAVATFSDGPFFVFHVPMALLGGLLLLFVVKPVFFRKRAKPTPALSLTEEQEPLLFAYVRKLCAATGAKPPARIEVDCDANAHARLRKGIFSMVGGDLVLRIGLPLAAHLSLRQFTGVMAHELGHFNQRHGMNGSYLIRRLTFFFARIVFQRDRLDERLLRHRHSDNVLRRGYYWMLLGPIEAARGVLWLMLVVGELLTCGVMRRMEFDADRVETLVAGTSDFIATSHALAFLSFASQVSRADLMETWEGRRLADDLPRLIAINGRYLADTRGDLLKRLEREKTRWLDTHPSHNDRIRQAELLGAEALHRLDAPAEQLFGDFADVCKRATLEHYRAQLGEKSAEAQLIPTAAYADERMEQRQAYRALRRFVRGNLVMMQPVFPNIGADRPLENPQSGRTALRAARDAMVRAAEKLGPGARRLEKDAVVIAAARAHMDLCSIFIRSPQAARVQARATRTLKKTQPLHGQAREEYQPFAAAARARLTTALRLLQSEGINWPRAGGGENYVIARRARAAQLIGVCRVLEDLSQRMNKLADLSVLIRVLTSAYNPKQPQPPLVRKILATVDETAEILRQFWRELSGIPYPFKHSSEEISIGTMVVPAFPRERDPVDTHACAVTALNAYGLLVTRVLAELTQLAEQAEGAAELEALPDFVEPEDSSASGRGSGSVWRYWVGYGARAVAGVAMFSVLVWMSIFPPVLPQMPWDDGSSPGGYQPNSFHVPFTPARTPMNYPMNLPGSSAPGRPGMPPSRGPLAPMRPGAPRPPGSPQRQPSSPWYSPSRSSPSYSPSPWGGGGGGGGGHSGGGGGGHR